ncbi:MAG TPA: hypothetical protein P5091_06755 [Acholeplasmataceae bacterium]|jgi:hypothetical protein|nr:hypothetical protein [Acholeplasmataceae bacterium]
MKNIVKLSLYTAIFLAIFLRGSDLISRLITDQDTITNTSLLFQYGGMIGFCLFIIFIVMLQTDSIQKFKLYRPKLSQWIYLVYVTIGLMFIGVTLVSFTLQIAIIMALLFMLVTAILDMVRDKIIQETEGKHLHPKKTM